MGNGKAIFWDCITVDAIKWIRTFCRISVFTPIFGCMVPTQIETQLFHRTNTNFLYFSMSTSYLLLLESFFALRGNWKVFVNFTLVLDRFVLLNVAKLRLTTTTRKVLVGMNNTKLEPYNMEKWSLKDLLYDLIAVRPEADDTDFACISFDCQAIGWYWAWSNKDGETTGCLKWSNEKYNFRYSSQAAPLSYILCNKIIKTSTSLKWLPSLHRF